MPGAQQKGPYRVLVGLNAPDASGAERRYEPGETVAELPRDAVKWLLDQMIVEKVSDA